ncbi:hypothetical protein HPB48_024547 [Haemaphysalis longicornis]|uniref:Uncharacterized protein n=1 Tax=Haemaphysalis longicornis TaxID=44386 RepID=A0A9J6H7V5_HAELO|nr:hypothetical protein HPB48_024547 [Haemaphysalis longicornis]
MATVLSAVICWRPFTAFGEKGGRLVASSHLGESSFEVVIAKYRYPEEVDLPRTSSRLKDVDGLGTSVDHYSSSAVESPRKLASPVEIASEQPPDISVLITIACTCAAGIVWLPLLTQYVV